MFIWHRMIRIHVCTILFNSLNHKNYSNASNVYILRHICVRKFCFILSVTWVFNTLVSEQTEQTCRYCIFLSHVQRMEIEVYIPKENLEPCTESSRKSVNISATNFNLLFCRKVTPRSVLNEANLTWAHSI